MSVYNRRIGSIEPRGDLWLINMEFRGRAPYGLCLPTRVFAILYGRITGRNFATDYLNEGTPAIIRNLRGKDVYSPDPLSRGTTQ